MRGLLAAQGRKSMRNIATLSGGQAVEQSLHHFITNSTWDWRPVREELARFLQRRETPQAWVVDQLEIAKAGQHSVGVSRQYAPGLGKIVNAQRAYGIWFACDRLSVPVNWRLLLPAGWTDRILHRHGRTPDTVCGETPEECATATVLESVHRWDVERRPVILDTRTMAVGHVARRLANAGVPFLARIGSDVRLTAPGLSLPGYGNRPVPAQQLLEAIKNQWRPVELRDPTTGSRRISLVATARVGLHGDPGRLPRAPWNGLDARSLTVLGEWHDPRRAPAQLWLTNMTSPGGQLLGLTRLTDRVTQDLGSVGDQVGLRDFTGRSYEGWHRHMTLASAAHAASLLTAAVADWTLDDYAEEVSG